MIFILSFIKELKKSFKYTIIGFLSFIALIASSAGLSWGTGYLIDKVLDIEKLAPYNYAVYGFYILASFLFISVLLLLILIWILLSYKSAIDNIKQGNNG